MPSVSRKPSSRAQRMRHRRGSNRGRQPAVFRARSHPGISPDPAHLFFQPRRLYTPGLDWYVQPYLYWPPLFTTCLTVIISLLFYRGLFSRSPRIVFSESVSPRVVFSESEGCLLGVRSVSSRSPKCGRSHCEFGVRRKTLGVRARSPTKIPRTPSCVSCRRCVSCPRAPS